MIAKNDNKITTTSSAANQHEKQNTTTDKDPQRSALWVSSEKHQHVFYTERKLQEVLCRHDTEPKILENTLKK